MIRSALECLVLRAVLKQMNPDSVSAKDLVLASWTMSHSEGDDGPTFEATFKTRSDLERQYRISNG
jgi:hypothetical protein